MIGKEKEISPDMSQKTTTQNKPLGIYKKFYDLQQKMFGVQVEKSGLNKFSNYAYSTKEDVVKAVKSGIEHSGLIFIPTYPSDKFKLIDVYGDKVDKGGKVYPNTRLSSRAEMVMVMLIIDPETGEKMEIELPGSAEDTQDKAVWKSYTGLFKYFWMRTFGLQDDDLSVEPENDDPVEPSSNVKGKQSNQPKSESEDSDTELKKKRDAALFKKLKSSIGESEIDWDKALKYFNGTVHYQEVKQLYEKNNA